MQSISPVLILHQSLADIFHPSKSVGCQFLISHRLVSYSALGLVSITAGCSVLEPWAAIICGMGAAPLVILGEIMLEWIEVTLARDKFDIAAMLTKQ